MPKTSDAAKSRYLYIPPSYGEFLCGLRRIPTSALSLLTSPLTSVLVPGVMRDALKLDNLPAGTTDESVDAFFRRRFGDKFAQIVGSAMIHGIYAADSRKIGVRSAFPTMWDAAQRGGGSLVRGELLSRRKVVQGDHDIGDVSELMKDASVYSFKNGLQTLTDALESHLATRENVEILRDTAISSVEVDDSRIQVRPFVFCAGLLPLVLNANFSDFLTQQRDFIPLERHICLADTCPP